MDGRTERGAFNGTVVANTPHGWVKQYSHIGLWTIAAGHRGFNVEREEVEGGYHLFAKDEKGNSCGQMIVPFASDDPERGILREGYMAQNSAAWDFYCFGLVIQP